MKIRTVYLAGGINGLPDSEANDWRTEAKRLLPREIGVLDPMARDYRGTEDENVEAIVNGDLADIKMCQAMIAYCPRPSWGTAMEIHWAKTTRVHLGHPTCRIVAVVPSDTPVSPWLRHHTHVVVATIEAAVEHVKAWAE